MPIGTTEIIVIVAIVLLLFFGPKKIPELTRAIGKAVGEFRKGKEGKEK